MKVENLEKGTELLQEIKRCRKYINKCNYILSENVVERTMDIKFNGESEGIIIPKSLFRIVGKLVKTEYILMLNEYSDKFDEL